jgi:ribose transport system permease protein
MAEQAAGRRVETPGGQLAQVWRVILRFQSYFGLIAILILATALSPERNGQNVFLDPSNLLNVVRFAAINGIIALGMTLVILTGGIDLSVGAVLALAAVGAASVMTRQDGGLMAAVLVALGVGGACGLVNGVVTTRLGLQSFITTLAMLSAARGLASLWAGGYAIPLAFGDGPGVAPQSFQSLFAGSLHVLGLSVPAPVFYFVGLGLLAMLLLRRTAFGRHVYAVGGNEAAARLSGVNVNRVKVAVFTISGLLAGFAALLQAALVNQGSPIDGNGYELNAIAAVVIGGTSLAGGVGAVAGTMVGAVILSVLNNILGLLNVQAEYQLILKGVVIVLAVALQRQRR